MAPFLIAVLFYVPRKKESRMCLEQHKAENNYKM